MLNPTESFDAPATTTTGVYAISDETSTKTSERRKLTTALVVVILVGLLALTGAFVKQTNTANTLRDTNHSLVSKSSHLRASLQTVTTQRDRAQAHFTASQARLQRTAAKLTATNHTVTSLRSQLNSANQQITSLNQQGASLSQRLNDANGQVSSLNGELNTANGQLNTANMNTRKCQAAVSDLKTVVALSSQFIGYTGDFIYAESLGDVAGMQAAVDGMTSTNNQLEAIGTQTSNDVNACIGATA
jgi:peptidoglycan hydrolase CwlO-like protein